MRPTDLLRLAFANLLRNRTRSGLTLVGVAIGVAALLALVSYGAGLQQNARGEFDALELYNTLRVTSRPNPFGSLGDLAFRQRPSEDDSLDEVPLTDSLVQAFQNLDGVLAAYPEVTFPAQIEAGDRVVIATVEAVPMAFGAIPSYRPETGAFFEASSDSAVLVSPTMARRLGYDGDPAAIVGDSVTLVTATLDLAALQLAARAMSMGMGTLPLREERHRMRVAGLLEEDNQALAGIFRAVVPLERAQAMRKLTFFSTLDLLVRNASAGGYAAVRVQLDDADAYPDVRAAIEEVGVFATGFRDQFQQLERLFLVMDLALGIVGFIALLVATIGIANTMMMNVMERTREIGVMKAVGGDEGDLQRLFVMESVTLGAVGGVLGLVAGWALTRLIGYGVNAYLYSKGLPRLDVFHATPLMALAILAIAVGVSLVAGFAPARKAARVEPMEALRSG